MRKYVLNKNMVAIIFHSFRIHLPRSYANTACCMSAHCSLCFAAACPRAMYSVQEVGKILNF